MLYAFNDICYNLLMRVIVAFCLLFKGALLMNGYCQDDKIQLPQALKESEFSIEQALNERESVRKFSSRTIDIRKVSQILWAGYGSNRWGKLTAPSAGAIYPLSLYALTGNVSGISHGLYRYDNTSHSLVKVSSEDKRAKISSAAFGQDYISQAPLVIVIAADYESIMSRYGKRGRRYADIEAGHVGQNIYLQAVSLGLGTVAVGAFDDEAVKGVLGIKDDPLYIMPVGEAE
ncbi:MAG: SagB/ThcOx family dehydrogenase [Candidatus Omnitrophota bacterium]